MPESLAANAAIFACMAFVLMASGCTQQEGGFSLDCANSSNYTACMDIAMDYISACTPVRVYALSNGSTVVRVDISRDASGGCTVRAEAKGAKDLSEGAGLLATGDAMTCTFRAGETGDFEKHVDPSHCSGTYFDKTGGLGLEAPDAPAGDGVELVNGSCGPDAAVALTFLNGGSESYITSGIRILENHVPSEPGSLEWSMSIYDVAWSGASGGAIDSIPPQGTATCAFTCNAGNFGTEGRCSYVVQFRDGSSAKFSC